MKKVLLSVFSLALLFTTFSGAIASTSLDNKVDCKCMGGHDGADDDESGE